MRVLKHSTLWEGKMKSLLILLLFYISNLSAHVPLLLPPLDSFPMSSFYIGQSDISRTIYSELTLKDSYVVLNLTIKESQETLIDIFTPHCKNIPQYEIFQPTTLVIKGDLPWKFQGESNKDYLLRLENRSIISVDSNYVQGARPKYYEEHAKMYYWIGAKWEGKLEGGLYSIVIFDRNGHKGNFNFSMNKKEDWTPDLFRYVEEVLPKIKKGFCHPKGYSGSLVL